MPPVELPAQKFNRLPHSVTHTDGSSWLLDQRQLFYARPGFDFVLTLPGPAERAKLLRVFQHDWPPRPGVPRAALGEIMLPHPAGEVIGAANIERAVRTLEHIHEVH